jgi:hypothetical protein
LGTDAGCWMLDIALLSLKIREAIFNERGSRYGVKVSGRGGVPVVLASKEHYIRWEQCEFENLGVTGVAFFVEKREARQLKKEPPCSSIFP